MGLFDRWKGKTNPEPAAFPVDLSAPARGTVVRQEDIPDQLFSEGILGTCIGVDPERGEVYSPVDATVTALVDSLHAVGLKAAGMELLIHVGVDTVEMNGDGFTAKCEVGQKVHKGDLLLTMDLAKIAAAGHPSCVILAVTNTGDFAAVEPVGNGAVAPGDILLTVRK